MVDAFIEFADEHANIPQLELGSCQLCFVVGTRALKGSDRNRFWGSLFDVNGPLAPEEEDAGGEPYAQVRLTESNF